MILTLVDGLAESCLEIESRHLKGEKHHTKQDNSTHHWDLQTIYRAEGEREYKWGDRDASEDDLSFDSVSLIYCVSC